MREATPGSLGHSLRRARRTLDLSQAELARKLGLRGPLTVSRWEVERQRPAARLVKPLAAILGAAPHPHGATVLHALGIDAPPTEVASLRAALAAAVTRHADAIDASPKRVRIAVLEALEIAERQGVSVREARLALGEDAGG